MPKFINQIVDHISVGRGHPLLVAPGLGGKVNQMASGSSWHPSGAYTLIQVGVYHDGRATSYYWFESSNDHHCFIERSLDRPYDRAECRILLVPRKEVPLELLMELNKQYQELLQGRQSPFLRGQMDLAQEDNDAVFCIDGRRLMVHLALEGRIVVLRHGASRNASKWIPPGGSMLRSMSEWGQGADGEVNIWLYQPPKGRTVLLASRYTSEGTGIGFASESDIDRRFVGVIEHEGADYVKGV